jgi:hypothetical protein
MADTVAGSLAAAWWAAAMVPGGMEKAEAAEVIVGWVWGGGGRARAVMARVKGASQAPAVVEAKVLEGTELKVRQEASGGASGSAREGRVGNGLGSLVARLVVQQVEMRSDRDGTRNTDGTNTSSSILLDGRRTSSSKRVVQMVVMVDAEVLAGGRVGADRCPQWTAEWQAGLSVEGGKALEAVETAEGVARGMVRTAVSMVKGSVEVRARGVEEKAMEAEDPGGGGGGVVEGAAEEAA